VAHGVDPDRTSDVLARVRRSVARLVDRSSPQHAAAAGSPLPIVLRLRGNPRVARHGHRRSYSSFSQCLAQSKGGTTSVSALPALPAFA
jgi:hypothetical protein